MSPAPSAGFARASAGGIGGIFRDPPEGLEELRQDLRAMMGVYHPD